VVPYNPGLLKRLRYYINVEYCAIIAAFAYLHKYMHKESNIISAEFKNEHNEVERHIIKRYLRFTKGFTRIMTYGAAEEHSPIITLPIYIPGRNRIQFNLNTVIRESAVLQTFLLET
jgi:hypothetical protein